MVVPSLNIHVAFYWVVTQCIYVGYHIPTW